MTQRLSLCDVTISPVERLWQGLSISAPRAVAAAEKLQLTDGHRPQLHNVLAAIQNKAVGNYRRYHGLSRARRLATDLAID